MKIAWVTPYSTKSGIGRFSRSVSDGLSRAGHAVTIVRSEVAEVLDSSKPLPSLETVRWDDVWCAPDFWRPFDAVVYNVGDNYPFHAGAVELLERFPGVVVFHDYFLVYLFLGWREATRARALGDRILDDIYRHGTAVAFRTQREVIGWESHASEHFPLTEWIGRSAYGAVAHSGFYAERVGRCCSGPVLVTPLAYDGLADYSPLSERHPRRDVTLLTVGLVNQNKRVESVISAIAGSDLLRESCRYHVVGAIADQERDRLEVVARALSFDGLVVTGEVSNETLREEIEAADVICCLRWPILEGCSASAIEGMLSGRPVIVSDAGFYRELPDDLVFKVDPERELESLSHRLSQLVLDPGLRATVGARASLWARSTFSVERYVARLVPLLEDVARLKPVLGTAAHFGHLLAELGLRSNDPAADRVSSTLNALFGTDDDRSPRTKPAGEARGRDVGNAQRGRVRGWRHPSLGDAEVAEYRRRIDQITNRCSPSGWFHSLDLGNGLSAPGHIPLDVLRLQLERLNFPPDLDGQTFIDLGAWDGFYSFEAEQRGAARVLATDSFSWSGGGWGTKDGFLLAREILRSRVEDMDIDIMDVCPERVGLFDVVLFSGVLYHMRDPLKALKNAASVCKRQLIVETALGMADVQEPAMAYMPRVSGEDRSNYWRPNAVLVNLWLAELGFKKIEQRILERGYFNALR